jgi:hypothetical protein
MRSTPALRGHVACIGVELTLAMAGCIDYGGTLNHSRRRSTNYLLPEIGDLLKEALFSLFSEAK